MHRRQFTTALGTALLAVVAGMAMPGRAVAAAAPWTTFLVGTDGAVYASTLGATGAPAPPVPITSASTAPAGGGVAATRLPDGRPVAFVTAAGGGLVALRATGTGSYTRIPIGPPNLGVPGGAVAAAPAPGGVRAFFVGRTGALLSALVTATSAGTPVAVTAAGVAPAGGTIAATAPPGGGQPAVFLADNRGGLTAAWPASGGWITLPSGPPNITAPGSGVTAVGVPGGVNAFLSGRDGRIWLVFIPPPGTAPGEPEPITPSAVLPAGGALSATAGPDGAAGVFFFDAAGTLSGVTTAGGRWTGPRPITAGAVATPGSALAVTGDGTSLIAGWCGNDLALRPPWRWPWPDPGPDPGPIHHTGPDGFALPGGGIAIT